MTHRMAALWCRIAVRVAARDGEAERGDVPGWVLVTLMTAGIVMALWVVAEPQLRTLLRHALHITGDPNH